MSDATKAALACRICPFGEGDFAVKMESPDKLEFVLTEQISLAVYNKAGRAIAVHIHRLIPADCP